MPLKIKRAARPTGRQKPKPQLSADERKAVQRASMAKARAIGKKKKADPDFLSDTLFDQTKPKITPDRAKVFVKLLNSGFTASLALDYLFPPGSGSRPRTNSAQHKRWIAEWIASPLVITEVNNTNGASWEDLNHDQQITIALDHLDAQMARFLYTSDYNADDAPLGKIADARSALLARIKAKEGGASPWEEAMRDLLEGKLKSGPPQLASPKIPVIPAKITES